MATFQIFEDLEKENRITAPLKINGNLINNKDKRPTFGLLNNVANNGRDAGKPVSRHNLIFFQIQFLCFYFLNVCLLIYESNVIRNFF